MKAFSTFYAFIIAITTFTFSFSTQGLAQNYIVDSIAYQPYSFTAGRPILVRLDDSYSQALSIGFNFNFYGNTYSQLVVGSNGNLSFELSNAGGYDPWSFLNGCSVPGPNVPFNSIFPAYRDINNVTLGNITYQLIGTTPNRVFIVSYDSVPLFGSVGAGGNQCQDSSLSVFQVALYEGCNAIEVYIQHSPSDTGWNRGLGVVGIIDSTGTVGLAAPGRNGTAWTADNEAWRFSLVGSGACARSSAGLDQTLCINHEATMQAIGTGVWSASLSNPTAVVIDSPSSPATMVSGFSMAGSYALTWSTASDTSTIMVNVVSCSDSVWPGDADFNGLVDNDDLLPIGLGYDSTGPARVVQGTVWQADACTAWADSFYNYAPAVNFKYADCNGDGIIDQNDENAIIQNFSQLHNKSNGPAPSRSGIPTLYAVASLDTLHSGDTLNVDFVLGDNSPSVANFYGLAFTYNFDPLIVDSSFTSMSYGNTWIGGTTDKISLSKIFHNTGEIKTAVTRIDHTSRSGNGVIGSARFVINTQNLPHSGSQTYTNIGYISNIKAVDQMGSNIALNSGADTSQVKLTLTGINNLVTESIRILPNPAHSKVQISASHIITEISITNVIGQEVIEGSSTTNAVGIDISCFSGGVYFVSVKTENGIGISKLVVEK